MPPKDKEDRAKRFWYYFDECSVFFVMFVAVLCKETVSAMLKGDPLVHLVIKAPKIIGATLVTIVVYGSSHESFKYNDRNKPPLIKRLSEAVLHGLAWQSLFDMGS